MNLLLVGLSHKTAPLPVRERFALPEEELGSALREIRQDYGLAEGMILCTCNRVEVLVSSRDLSWGERQVKEFLCRRQPREFSHLDRYAYVFRREEAVRHVFRVAGSLDSMVVGESQILGQLKQAYRSARQAGTAGRYLNYLMPRAFFVAKRIRTETRISESAVSVSSVAVELARKIFGSLEGKSVCLLGAGKMSELAVRHLVQFGVSQLFVANRTLRAANQLAARYGGQAVHLDQADPYLVRSDILIVSTGAPHLVISREKVLEVIRQRRYRPLFIIDISVPRNVDPQANEVENVFLYDIDDLQGVIDANLKERLREAQLAEQIVNQEVDAFCRSFSSRSLGPLIGALRRRIEEICLEELERQRSSLEEEEYERLRRVMRRAAHRIAHPLILELKKEGQARTYLKADLIKRMFRLDGEEP